MVWPFEADNEYLPEASHGPPEDTLLKRYLSNEIFIIIIIIVDIIRSHCRDSLRRDGVQSKVAYVCRRSASKGQRAKHETIQWEVGVYLL